VKYILATPLLLLPALLAAQAPAPSVAAHEAPPAAVANDNRVAAGTRAGRRISVTLEPRVARWMPSADTGFVFTVHAWAEPGAAPRIPGPLLRARVGDELRITLRNPLHRDLVVAGLGDRAVRGADTVRVPAGGSRTVALRPTRPGSYWYDGTTHLPTDSVAPSPFPGKHLGADETLVGGLVVDEADAPADVARRERVLVVHLGADAATFRRVMEARGVVPDSRAYVNGAGWPATERLNYTVGDTVRWRVINTGFLPHPMHLHGFYFRVDARGDAHRDTVYAPAAQRMAVTETMEGYTTARLTWVPERAGNWLFHCHFLLHMTPWRLPPGRVATAPPPPVDHGDPEAHLRHGMAGLVMGVHVRDRGAPVVEPDAPDARRLALWVTRRDRAMGDSAGYGFVLQEDGRAPAPDSVRRPGTAIVLERGRPVAITVHNTLAKPVAVHWHGMELESRFDGVGGWSGHPGSVTPPIAPGGRFEVRFTPPRAGTFMYHTHDEAGSELAAGLFGPLLVLEPGERLDPSRDQTIMFSSGYVPPAPGVRPVPFVNGDTGATPIRLTGGAPQRLRLVNIAGSDLKRVRLVAADGAPLRWRIVGKDGWTPPAHQSAVVHPAELLIGVGETYDVEISADEAGRATVMEVETRYYPGWKRVRVHDARIPVHVAAQPSAASP
jgi:FtsP/CotA-like multicopper oxidase with cupredoxin domain